MVLCTNWRERLAARYGIELVVPPPGDRAEVHRVIYEELCRGDIRAASRAAYGEIIGRLAEEYAEAVILGCTEIPLLIGAADSPLPAFDTTALHAQAAVDFLVAEVTSTPAGRTPPNEASQRTERPARPGPAGAPGAPLRD